jgi:predicted peptidase
MYRFGVFLVVIGLFVSSCSTVKRSVYLPKVFKSAAGTGLPYNVFYPSDYGHKDVKSPLILFLHGAGERGSDNISQLIHIAPKLTSAEVQAKFPAVCVFPQCPAEEYWAPVNRFEWTTKNGGEVTPPMQAVIQLLDKMLQDPRIDKSRIYVAGLSMGGFGTLDLLSRKPGVFAAAIPICGGADLDNVYKYKNVPMWIFHGAKDNVVTPKLSRDLVQKLKSLGITPLYTEYPEGGHDVWNAAFDEPTLLPWLFSQHK